MNGYYDEDDFDGLDMWHGDHIESDIDDQVENDQMSAAEAGFLHGANI